MTNPEIERLLDLAAQLPVEMRAAFLEQECPDPDLREFMTAVLRDAEEAEAYFDSIIRGTSGEKPEPE